MVLTPEVVPPLPNPLNFSPRHPTPRNLHSPAFIILDIIIHPAITSYTIISGHITIKSHRIIVSHRFFISRRIIISYLIIISHLIIISLPIITIHPNLGSLHSPAIITLDVIIRSASIIHTINPKRIVNIIYLLNSSHAMIICPNITNPILIHHCASPKCIREYIVGLY